MRKGKQVVRYNNQKIVSGVRLVAAIIGVAAGLVALTFLFL